MSKSAVLLNISMAVLYQYNNISIFQLYRHDIQCNTLINKNEQS